MKKYILTGKPSEVQKVIRENRIRIGRGDIIITPLQDEEVQENPHENESGEDGNNEGENILDNGNIDDENIQSPDEPASEDAEINIPEIADDKNIELEDLKEVDPEADEKNVPDDSKDVPAPDTKKAEAAKKTSKRTKKSE